MNFVYIYIMICAESHVLGMLINFNIDVYVIVYKHNQRNVIKHVCDWDHSAAQERHKLLTAVDTLRNY